MKDPEHRTKTPPLTISMLTSEVVYKLIVAVERLLRWFNRRVIRPGRLLLWCLRWG